MECRSVYALFVIAFRGRMGDNMFPHTFVIRWGLRCRAFLRMLSILSLGCRWMLDESGSSSTK